MFPLLQSGICGEIASLSIHYVLLIEQRSLWREAGSQQVGPSDPQGRQPQVQNFKFPTQPRVVQTMKGVVFGISNNEFTIGVLAKTASDLQGNLGGGPERGPESLLQDSVATSEEPP